MSPIKRLLLILIIGAGLNYFDYLPVTPVLADEAGTEIGEALTVSLMGDEETQGQNTIDLVGCTRVESSVVNAAYEQRVMELLNIERAKAGVAPLKRNSDLDYAARYQARDMVEDQYFSHDTLDQVNGSLTFVCNPIERVKLYYSGYSAFGENLAAGYDTPEDVVAGWMNSEGHRLNILNANYREVGVGFYEGKTLFREYWALDFGAKSGVYPVIINSEAAQTNTPNVSLYLYGGGVWGEVRLRNNADVWSAWMPFQERMTWQIPPVDGTHLLSVELRKTGATIPGAASSDTITLSGFNMVDKPYRVYLPTVKR